MPRQKYTFRDAYSGPQRINKSTIVAKRNQQQRQHNLCFPKMSDKSSYIAISSFVDGQCRIINEQNNKQLDEEQVPLEIQNIIRKHANEKFERKTGRVTRDVLATRVYDLQSEWKVKEQQRITRFIGDVPKYAIGTDLGKNITDASNGKSLLSRGGTNLYRLMDDIYDLPAILPKEDATSKDKQLLQEYDSMRQSLKLQCDAIRLGEDKLTVATEKADAIKSLEQAVHEEYGSDHSLADYIPEFYDKLQRGLDEMRDLLEQLIKSSDTSAEKKRAIETILAGFNN